MSVVFVDIQTLSDDIKIPEYAHQGDACFDIRSSQETTIYPNDPPILVETGLIFDIPNNYELQIRSRSGTPYKHQVIIPNSPGTIDSCFKKPIKIMMVNIGQTPFKIEKGDRIAQGVIKRVPQVVFRKVEKIYDNDRGEGFNSSGVK